MKTPLPVIALILGVALGWAVHSFSLSTGDSELDTSHIEQKDMVLASEYDAVVAKYRRQVVALKKSLQIAREQEAASTTKQDELYAEVLKLREDNAAMKEVLAGDDAKKAKRMADIESRFKSLAAKGSEALISSNEIGKLVGDLLQEGQKGRDAVLALLTSEDEDEKMLGVMLMLQGMASVESIDPLKDMALGAGDETMQRMASQVLMRMEDKEAESALEKIVAETKNEGVKVNSLFGLAKQGNAKGVQQLLDYYNDPNSKHRGVLSGSFLILRNPESQPLIDAVVAKYKNRDENERIKINEAAIGYYGHVKTPRARTALQRMADDPSVSARIRQMAQDTLNGM